MDKKENNSGADEAHLIFDYLEQVVQKDGVVTRAEFERWHEKIGPDLDGDGIVSKAKLYRLEQRVKSKYTGRDTVCYLYKTEPCEGYKPYLVGEKHMSEFDLAVITSKIWTSKFEDLVQDGQITRDEFVRRCMQQY